MCVGQTLANIILYDIVIAGIITLGFCSQVQNRYCKYFMVIDFSIDNITVICIYNIMIVTVVENTAPHHLDPTKQLKHNVYA